MSVLVFLFADLTPASAVSGSVGLFAAFSAPYFLLVEAEVWLWPRPIVAAVDAARPSVRRAADRLLVAVANARFDVREAVAEARLYAALSLRELAVSAAALLALLVPAHSESAR